MEHAHHPVSGMQSGHHDNKQSLNRVALSATLHCLTGCGIGEVLGMVIGTALGLGTWPTIALAVVLAFFFGYLLTMLAAPEGWYWLIVGFVLFRLFDIWKPWPIGWLDRRVGGGFGIMLDDLVAGLFAALCLQGLAHWL